MNDELQERTDPAAGTLATDHGTAAWPDRQRERGRGRSDTFVNDVRGQPRRRTSAMSPG